MDKRLDPSKSGYRDDVSSHSKKSKKRSSKRNSMFNSWMNSVQNNQNNDVVPGMEHQHVLWQSNVQQNFPSNGQRLFTTASDPSMCGYAQMPMTYAMEPVSLPAMYRLYQPVPFSGIRTIPNRPRRNLNQTHPMDISMNSMANGFTSLQENGMASPIPVNYQNGDYASLPPTANRNNGINGDELNSEHRRYSDPGLGSAEAPAQSEDPDSVDSGSSVTTIGRSNKLVLSLIEQMTELKKSNSQLFKELNETKSELGSMKAKLAQCKYNGSSDYQPGMLSDFIREIRQANKTCEEGLVSKVKAIVEEKLNQRSLEVANLNNQIVKLMEEKEESEKRITKLEEEVATLRLNANNEGREIAAFEEETLALRRELQEARASKNLAENHVANPATSATWTVDEDNRATQSPPDDATFEESSSLTNSDLPIDSKKEDETEAVEENVEEKVAAEETKVNSEEGAESNVESSSGTSRRSTRGSRKDDEPRQRGGSKKSRKKKNAGAKRAFSETEKPACSETLNENAARDGRRTVSEDDDRLDDEDTCRAITEIPEVTVVGGGSSFVPKDLCSTGILTSRVLTAPSRATYTTAYI
ncbi:COPII coat assembly protein SEC16 isoform X3 [Osmia bicornis bicornis]|uniref:COPII coat assembly protein SEC16 isoform X3 n=1 Tax=Osmia bicornis bicornis TaxID=1437191 RepID=UPI001EAF041E|nr:COPII coat assembly protein SEC16 isoform X3 [Osmia bicornis bicornis]